jgi:hypothetical protein
MTCVRDAQALFGIGVELPRLAGAKLKSKQKLQTAVQPFTHMTLQQLPIYILHVGVVAGLQV